MELSHLSWEEFHLLLCVFWQSFTTESYVALSFGQHGDGGWAKPLCPCPALKDQQGKFVYRGAELSSGCDRRVPGHLCQDTSIFQGSSLQSRDRAGFIHGLIIFLPVL